MTVINVVGLNQRNFPTKTTAGGIGIVLLAWKKRCVHIRNFSQYTQIPARIIKK